MGRASPFRRAAARPSDSGSKHKPSGPGVTYAQEKLGYRRGQFGLAVGQDAEHYIADRLGFLEPGLRHIFDLEERPRLCPVGPLVVGKALPGVNQECSPVFPFQAERCLEPTEGSSFGPSRPRRGWCAGFGHDVLSGITNPLASQ